MLDPVVTPVKDMERHHLFPRRYLAELGITENSRVNAIANMVFIDWADNIAISSKSPAVYWAQMAEELDAERLKRQEHWHALPIGWQQLDYDEFCERRRKLISRVVKEGFERLWESHVELPSTKAAIQELVENGESNVLEFKERARWSHGTDKKGKSEQIIVKSIAGFMNSEGGSLLIGVDDAGIITGLEEDYTTLAKGNRDGFELFLTQLIGDKISGPSPSLCRVSFHSVGDKEVCRVDVSASSKPVFSRPLNSKKFTDFWVRQGNKTEQFHGSEMIDYKDDHWS